MIDGNGNGHGTAVANLSDDLIARAKAIASRSDDLLEMLDDARQRLVDPSKPKREVRPKREGEIGLEPVPEPASESAPEEPVDNDRPEEVSEGLRLLTTQMSVAGADREEIAAALKDEFGVENPDAILKSIDL